MEAAVAGVCDYVVSFNEWHLRAAKDISIEILPPAGAVEIDWRKQMKAIELNLPDDVYEKLESLTSHDQQSVNAFALRRREECARAFEDFRVLERRAQRGSRENFEAAMAKVANKFFAGRIAESGPLGGPKL